MSDQHQFQINTKDLHRYPSTRTMDDSVRVVVPEAEQKRKHHHQRPLPANNAAVLIPLFVEVPPMPPTMMKPIGLGRSSHKTRASYAPTFNDASPSPERKSREAAKNQKNPTIKNQQFLMAGASGSDTDSAKQAGLVFGFPSERSPAMTQTMRDPLDTMTKHRPLRGVAKNGRRKRRGSLKMSGKYDSLGESDHDHDYRPSIERRSMTLDDFELKMSSSESNLDFLVDEFEIDSRSDDRRKALHKSGHSRVLKHVDSDPSCLQLSATGQVVTMKIQNPILFKTTSNCA